VCVSGQVDVDAVLAALGDATEQGEECVVDLSAAMASETAIKQLLRWLPELGDIPELEVGQLAERGGGRGGASGGEGNNRHECLVALCSQMWVEMMDP
jgi:DNA-binding transcriptional ArsR family regulator